MEIRYFSTSYIGDVERIRERIFFYLERSNFIIEVEDCVILTFEEELSKEEFLKVEISMCSMGYVRY
jgi:hypothetical protein